MKLIIHFRLNPKEHKLIIIYVYLPTLVVSNEKFAFVSIPFCRNSLIFMYLEQRRKKKMYKQTKLKRKLCMCFLRDLIVRSTL